ncbi:MAG: hypothetical protein F9K44_13010 [Hyphomicrobiaceae bacterium]|nr:MAG: hypothetical protein F9K44_13010 [Hyphomicrobiaceae bacterium]
MEALRTPIEWNELKPDFGAANGRDPIVHLKSLSGDGTGARLLTEIEVILQAECKAPAEGAKDGLFVWPRLADARLDRMSPEDETLLSRLTSPEEADAMRSAGRWTGWRLAIGRDGTWHSLKKSE